MLNYREIIVKQDMMKIIIEQKIMNKENIKYY